MLELGIQELRSKNLCKMASAEILGTAMLVILGCGSALSTPEGLQPSIVSIAFAFGLAVGTVVWSLGHVSGAHINPAVTLAMLCTCQVSVCRCVVYCGAQCVGAIVGAAILYGVTPESSRGSLGSTALANDVSWGHGLGVEIVATFVLVFAVFASCDKLRTDHGGSVALSIGLVVTMDVMWAIKFTGCSMNPARSLGPAVISGTWSYHWVFWVGPCVGAVIAGLLYKYVFAVPDSRETVPTSYVNIRSNDDELRRDAYKMALKEMMADYWNSLVESNL